MRKSDRLFQLTNLLRAHQPVTATVLAEKLSVSTRTIYRYIDDLSVSGVPVYGEAGVGYRLTEGFELPPLQLTPKELEALMVGVSMVSSWTGAELGQASRVLLSKIEASLPGDVFMKLNLQRVVRVPGEHHRPADYAYWDRIHESIANARWLTISYRSLAGATSIRTIFPLGLFYWGGKWTLGSWCHLKQAYRDFRIDRIECLESVDAPAVVPDFVTLTNYIAVQKSHSPGEGTDTMLSGEGD